MFRVTFKTVFCLCYSIVLAGALTGCLNLDLYNATKEGNTDKVKQALENGADPNYRHPFTVDTPLIEAARYDHQEIASLLMKHGADVNLKGEAWYTPLHCAAGGGHIGMVKLVLSHNADLHLFSHHNTTLHSSIASGDLEIVKLLIEKGAVPTAKGIDESTPLELASGQGHIQIVEYLLSLDIDVNAQGIYGRTALHAAAWNDEVEVARLLLEHGANPDLECNGRPVVGKSKPLQDLLHASRRALKEIEAKD